MIVMSFSTISTTVTSSVSTTISSFSAKTSTESTWCFSTTSKPTVIVTTIMMTMLRYNMIAMLVMINDARIYSTDRCKCDCDLKLKEYYWRSTYESNIYNVNWVHRCVYTLFMRRIVVLCGFLIIAFDLLN